MYELGPPRSATPRPQTWGVSVAVAVALAVGLGVVELVLLAFVLGVGPPERDPHGYASIFAFLPFVGLLPPLAFAVVGFVGLLRRRAYGYVFTAVAAIWVTVPALLGLAGGVASGGAAPWFAPSLFVALTAGGGAVAAVLGLRNHR